jgi:hypothetical protein
MELVIYFNVFIYIQLKFLALVASMIRYKYFLIILIMIESIILNISILLYIMLGDDT